MTDRHAVTTVVALVAVLVLAGASGPVAASEHLSLSCADGDDGAVYLADGGLDVSDDTAGGVAVNPFIDETTLAFDNVTIQADGSARTVLETTTADRVCLGETNATATPIRVDSTTLTSVTLDGRLTALTYGPISYDTREADLRYDAPEAPTLTLADAPANTTVTAVDAATGADLTTATATDGTVRLTLPAGAHAVDLHTPTGTGSLAVTIAPETITAGNTTTVTVTTTDATTGEPVDNATVAVPGLGLTAPTTASGDATLAITDPDPGDYEVSASADGYADATATLTVERSSGTGGLPTDPGEPGFGDVLAVIQAFNTNSEYANTGVTPGFSDVLAVIQAFNAG